MSVKHRRKGDQRGVGEGDRDLNKGRGDGDQTCWYNSA